MIFSIFTKKFLIFSNKIEYVVYMGALGYAMNAFFPNLWCPASSAINYHSSMNKYYTNDTENTNMYQKGKANTKKQIFYTQIHLYLNIFGCIHVDSLACYLTNKASYITCSK